MKSEVRNQVSVPHVIRPSEARPKSAATAAHLGMSQIVGIRRMPARQKSVAKSVYSP